MAGLVADIGATNVRFALASQTPPGGISLARVQDLRADDFATLADAVDRYLDDVPKAERPRAGTFAVAAPVSGDAIALTNCNDWRFSVNELRGRLGFEHLFVINDFTAISLSLLKLSPEAVVAIGPAAELSRLRTVGVIGPGSGLGVGALLDINGRHVALPSEGGHVNFAPQTDIEWKIANHLATRYGHVSNERILSGPGLVDVVACLHEIAESAPPGLTAAEIVAGGVDGDNPLCREALDIFCAVLGSAAGDLALLLYADAVFIGGGIVPRFVDFVRQSQFRARFEAKGRYAAHLAKIPTLIITEKYPGLIGAGVHLAQHHAA